MKAYGINFGEWWGRITRQSQGAAPEVAPLVQPVLVVADHRRLSSYPDTADGVAGFEILPVVGNFSSFILRCRSRGGLIVHWFYVFKPNGGAAGEITYRWAVVPPPSTDGPAGNGITNANPSRPCVSSAGTRVNPVAYLIGPLINGDSPLIQGGDQLAGNIAPQFRGPIFIPNGQSLTIEGDTTNQGLNGSVYLTELDSAIPRP